MNDQLLKQMPDDMSKLPVDPEHLNRVLINGYFQQHVMVRGEKRRFITYIPEEMDNCQPCLVVAPPADTKGPEFLEDSGLKRLADEKKLFVFLLLPEEGKWDLSGVDAEFMNGVYVEAQARDYYVTMQDNFYACGIGEGADVAQQAACKMSSEWSGLFTIGNLESDLETSGDENALGKGTQDGELQIAAERSQLPVWMVFETMEGKNAAAADYWKKNNHVTEEMMSTAEADYIWLPNPIRQTLDMDEERIAQVRVTLKQPEASYEQISAIWNYIGMARRHRGQGRKNLRYFKNPEVCGAVLQEREVDGLCRIWYEYVPKCCTPDETWPLVVVMHGRGGTAETFFDISNMFQVANRRKFIVAWPQAGVYQQKEGGLKNVALWEGTLDGKAVDDVKFIRTIVGDMTERLPIDKGRVYACGQSSGGMMTDTLCEFAGDIFTATVSWSGLYAPHKVYMDRESSQRLVPSAVIYGDKDNLVAGETSVPGVPFTVSEEFAGSFEHKFERYGLDRSKFQTWQDYPITWYSYPNEQGVPMFTVGIVDQMVHANYPEESWISFDQFFCQFRRDENGTLYYRGTAVKEK